MTSTRVMDGNLNDRTWINISESRGELGIGNRVSFPTNLYLKKRVNSPYFYASWMPEKEDDYRVTNKKRTPLESSTGTADVRQASLNAITWVKEKQKECLLKITELVEVKTKCLAHYWEIHFDKFAAGRSIRNSATKLLRDEKNKWYSPTYGIEKEKFSKIRVDQITRQHLEDYFLTLKQGMKSQQKTLIRSLFSYAESDFVGHTFPTFPKISKVQTEQVKHFDFDEFECLMKTINELSNGAARSPLSFEEYSNLDSNPFNRKNQRNWVDLYDAIWVNYFWFLRSQDTQRLKIEWFTEDIKNQEFVCRNQEPKSDRRIEDTRNLKSDAYGFFKRLLNRREKNGWLIMPFTKRQNEGGQENQVTRNLNFILKIAVKECLPNWNLDDVTMTTIRHTSFRHHLEDDMTLGTYPKIIAFAKNGLTSPKMLQERYINYISRERTLRDSKKNMRSSDYSLVQKVLVN